MQLDPAATAAGFRLIAHETLDSTNAEALRYAFANPSETSPLWITAREQTAGRGRRGNSWISPPGNLCATLLMKDPASARHAPELSFVAALAVHDAIADCAPGLGAGLALKWPNDVLCGGAKLAGILLEGHRFESSLALAIGIGVNCKDHPSRTAYLATDLAAAGCKVSADDLFAALSRAMMRRLDQWRGGEGFSTVRSDWLGRAGGVGEDIKVQLPDRVLIGRFENLDERGCLLLRVEDGGVETIVAGDVFAWPGSFADDADVHDAR